jgi:hypothetical protein
MYLSTGTVLFAVEDLLVYSSTGTVYARYSYDVGICKNMQFA